MHFSAPPRASEIIWLTFLTETLFMFYPNNTFPNLRIKPRTSKQVFNTINTYYTTVETQARFTIVLPNFIYIRALSLRSVVLKLSKYSARTVIASCSCRFTLVSYIIVDFISYNNNILGHLHMATWLQSN